MKTLLLIIAGIFILSPLFSQEKSKTKNYEITAGFGMLEFSVLSIGVNF
jgi:hypothetical protein